MQGRRKTWVFLRLGCVYSTAIVFVCIANEKQWRRNVRKIFKTKTEASSTNFMQAFVLYFTSLSIFRWNDGIETLVPKRGTNFHIPFYDKFRFSFFFGDPWNILDQRVRLSVGRTAVSDRYWQKFLTVPSGALAARYANSRLNGSRGPGSSPRLL